MDDHLDALDAETFARQSGDSLAFESLDTEEFDMLDEFGDGEELGLDAIDSEDAFFKKMFRRVGKGLKKFKFLRKLAPVAGKIAGGFLGGPIGAKLGGAVGGMLREEEGIDGLDDLDAFGSDGLDFDGLDYEDESDAEGVHEDQPEAFGLDALSDGMIEDLAGLAAESESESEASALLGGVTVQIMSPTPITVRRMTPVMAQSASQLGRFLRRSRRTRPLVKAIPSIQKRATKSLVNKAKQGRRVTSLDARKAMAKATYKTLKSPAAAAKGIANNTVKRQRYRRINKNAIARAER